MVELINSWGSIWARYFGFAVAQNTIFLAVVFLALGLLRNAPARVKYAVTFVGLLKLLLPPFLIMPQFGFLPTGVQSGGLPPSLAGISVLSSSQAGHSAGLTVVGALLLVWVCLTLSIIAVSVLATGLLRLRLRGSFAADGIAVSINQKRRPVSVFMNERLGIPLSFGLRSDRIYLPATSKTWTPTFRNLALMHEQAHIARKDAIVQLMQLLAQAIYFFHPLVWLLNARMNEYREMACDDAAVAEAKISRLQYARFLVRLAENVVRSGLDFTSVSTLVRKKHKLLKRVNYQMEEGAMQKPSKTRVVTVLATLVLLVAALSWYCTTEKDAEEVKALDMAANINQGNSESSAGDVDPEPIGGFAAIQKHLVYPEAARKAGIQGRIYLRVTIDEVGQVVDAEVVKGICTKTEIDEKGQIVEIKVCDDDLGCDQAAIEAVKSVRWESAVQDGKPVAVHVGVPIIFKLK